MIRKQLEPTTNTYELISLSCNKIIPSKKRNQPAGKTPILQMNMATFQVVVTSAVTSVMTHFNTNNTNGSGFVINNPNRGDDQVQQRVLTHNYTPNLQMKNKKRMFWVKKNGLSNREE